MRDPRKYDIRMGMLVETKIHFLRTYMMVAHAQAPEYAHAHANALAFY